MEKDFVQWYSAQVIYRNMTWINVIRCSWHNIPINQEQP